LDEVDELVDEVLDAINSGQQPWIDNDQQETPYHSGW